MKIKRTETHDRLLQFKTQSDYISKGCQDCINSRPEEFENLPFYIFAHKRTLEMDERVSLFNQDIHCSILDPNYQRQYLSMEQVPSARLIWAPRLLKPKAQTNSMLFRAYPPGDNIKIIWMIPEKELWEQYQKGKMLEDNIICESIHMFLHDREKLEAAEPDEISEEKAREIYLKIKRNNENKKTFSILS